ncbi:hypothetical protein ASZ78_005822 [Callipepla squamata]|uniref:Interleukin-4 n=1 Tax=Callipepla squamata TaxID=9009 RepID=A0A226MIA9_CALSU|nr:hypothetical protein ASZ78_005822 [Callipepla squamata]
MSSSLPILLLLLVLLGGPGAASTLRSQPPLLLKESIQMIAKNIQKEASCVKLNVTDIFAGSETNNRTELLCKASMVVRESQHCHKDLQGLFLNMYQLVNADSTSLKENQGRHPDITLPSQAPCPVAAGNTTSMAKFLEDLHRFLQQLMKENWPSF